MSNSTIDKGEGKERKLTSEEIGDAIKTIKNFLTLKQCALANRANFGIRTIKRIETGKKISEIF